MTLGRGRGAAAGAGRAQRAALRAARGRGGHLAVELPDRDPVRDDGGRARRPATPSCSSPPSSLRLRPRARAGAARRRPAAGGAVAAAGEGDVGAALVAIPAAHDRVHRLAARRAGDHPRRRAVVGRPAPLQARRRRARRQELRDRLRRRGPRRGRPGDHLLGVRLRRSEMLGCLSRARPRGDRRRADRAARRRRAACSWSARPGAGDAGPPAHRTLPPRSACEAAASRREQRPGRRPGPAAPDGEGWFAAPIVVADLPETSPILAEEFFGPLLAVQRVRDSSMPATSSMRFRSR